MVLLFGCFMFIPLFLCLTVVMWCKLTTANCVSYLDVVSWTWGEVSEQGLWYVQVLSHLCEGGIGVGTHLLVPTGRNQFIIF